MNDRIEDIKYKSDLVEYEEFEKLCQKVFIQKKKNPIKKNYKL
jgi:hypothetical protein